MATHARNLGPMNEAPRCGARTRAGTLCQSLAISGKSRCRMHGGKGSGAPKGNRNPVRHGAYTKDVFEREVRVRGLCKRLRDLVRGLESERRGGAPVAGRNPSLPKEPKS
jgi:glucans biosynthesis protein